jgi:AAHS family 4-hydroxybenzoate transporter-like MFS transporter
MTKAGGKRGRRRIADALIDAGGTIGGGSMAQSNTIDVSRLIDERKMNAFNAQLVILSFFVILIDGYDIAAVAYAGPFLVKEWGLTSMLSLSLAFNAGLAGILFGSPLFGYVGDRFGRKKAIIASCLTFGVFTLAAVTAGSVTDLVFLRFLAGFGIGGLLPNIITINAEFAPKRVRATMIIVMFTGITFGGAVPFVVSRWLAPDYGWQALFWVGGITPLLISGAVLLWMPESIKFLVVKAKDQVEVGRLVRQLSPSLNVAPGTTFVIRDEQNYAAFSPKLLFADGLHYLTPLLWVLFVCNLMAFYFTNQWLPTVLPSVGVSRDAAAGAAALFQLGGTVGGFALCRLFDKLGLTPVVALFAVSLPVVGSIGYAVGSVPLLLVVAFFAGFCLLGLQYGINATSAMIYPTSIRSNGSGWAFGVGRFGSIAGPLLAGALIDMHFPIHQIFLMLLIPLGIGLVASFVMARLYFERFQGHGLGQREALSGD